MNGWTSAKRANNDRVLRPRGGASADVRDSNTTIKFGGRQEIAATSAEIGVLGVRISRAQMAGSRSTLDYMIGTHNL
jgi:hypothetical protein